jgi:hypothetical protein
MDRSIAIQIWLKRIQNNLTISDKDCWEYANTHFKLCGEDIYVSHFLYEHLKKKEKKGILRHTCGNRKCCNPDHLITPEKIDPIKLSGLLDKCLTTYEVAKILGCSQHSVMMRMNELGLKSKHKKRKRELKNCAYCGKETYNQYCTTHCWREHRYKQFIERWLKGQETGNSCKGMSTSAYVRRWIIERAHGRCEKCGWNKINPVTKRCPLTVHHKDGNSERTVPENLEAVCPNCHSLTETYGSLNKGHGRKLRYKRA